MLKATNDSKKALKDLTAELQIGAHPWLPFLQQGHVPGGGQARQGKEGSMGPTSRERLQEPRAPAVITVPTSATSVIPNTVAHIKEFLPSGDADIIGSAVIDETYMHWRGQRKFGPRGPFFDHGHKMARFGESGVTYSFKGTPKVMHQMTPTLVKLQQLINSSLSWRANCCVINSYAPGSGLFPHRDGKYIPQLGANPIIVALSFGARRTFLLHKWDPIANRRCKEPIALSLGHGDLVVMYGTCDDDYHHSIPEEPDVIGTRVSLTFRQHQT